MNFKEFRWHICTLSSFNFLQNWFAPIYLSRRVAVQRILREWSIAAVLPAGSFGKTVDCNSSGGKLWKFLVSAKEPTLNFIVQTSLMPFFTYILKSQKDQGYYYGHTADLDTRLKKHNTQRVRSTKSRVPFLLYYFVTFQTKSEAYRQEVFFKSVAGKVYLREKGII